MGGEDFFGGGQVFSLVYFFLFVVDFVQWFDCMVVVVQVLVGVVVVIGQLVFVD